MIGEIDVWVPTLSASVRGDPKVLSLIEVTEQYEIHITNAMKVLSCERLVTGRTWLHSQINRNE